MSMEGEPERRGDVTETIHEEILEEWQRTWTDLWEILGCKWTFHILRVLSMEADGCGFNELEGRIDGITSTMLSRRLKQLIDERLVEKFVVPTSPPSSTYELTEIGMEIADILQKIERLNPRRDDS